jgi:hypothetical protein
MTIDPNAENQARQAIWNFLLDRQARHGRKRCYLVSYPRSGSTLVRDYFAILQGRPQLSLYVDDVLQSSGAGLTAALAHVDVLKSHQMPPDDHPAIYLVRDGRNATLSFLYMSYLFGGHRFSEPDDLEEAIQWLDGTEGCWSDHVAEALQQSGKRPILFVRYEDMVASPESALGQMLHFLGVEVSASTLADCVRRQQRLDRYAENPHNGFLHRPPGYSIYALLQQHRPGPYWRQIFDGRSRRYFHERGGTGPLLHFGYERSSDWWKE